ncbi:MAG: CHASE2 domain-containing protein [Flavobacteriales bacterium]|nr:MAG: CHASE2 domain-containing protein [Flavobacteriales bacterium]
MRKRRRFFVQAASLACVALLLFGYVALIAVALGRVAHFVEPHTNLDENFDLYDYYFRARTERIRMLHGDILIVNVDSSTRTMRADAIERILAGAPECVVLDFYMRPSDTTDLKGMQRINSQIRTNPNVVAAYPLDTVNGRLQPAPGYLAQYPHPERFGFWDLQYQPARYTIRKVLMWVEHGNADTAFSLTAQVLRAVDRSVFKEVTQRSSAVRVNYRQMHEGHPFVTVPIGELLSLEPLEFNKRTHGKIVFLAKMGERGGNDWHYTPLNENSFGHAERDMPGVLVHAQTLAMFLNHDTLHELALVPSLILAWLIAFLVGMLLMEIHRRSIVAYAVLKIPIFIVSSLVVLFAGMWLFERSIMLPFSVLLVPMWLSGEAREIIDDLGKRKTKGP